MFCFKINLLLFLCLFTPSHFNSAYFNLSHIVKRHFFSVEQKVQYVDM